MCPKKSAPKRERLTLSQLASYDDILTDALVDHVSFACSAHIGTIQPSSRDQAHDADILPGLFLDYHPEESI